jgi:DNA repair exonuclease SbcCD nuclease subunit
MIYITGDIHGSIDIHKLSTTNFPEQKQLTKDDYVIICGDFGNVWNNSKEELYWRRWLNNKNFTTLFVDGNHCNFDLLNAYPISQWNGGNVHFISDSIIHLMRGQIFEINGVKLFTMGGAASHDKQYRREGISWWKEELPSYKEYEEALKNLDKNNWSVDYIITHTGPLELVSQFKYIEFENNQLEDFLNQIDEQLQYKHWYFGHFHRDQQIDEKHTVVYNNIIKIG